MKFGFRKPNLKSSIKARTTARVKKAMNKAINPVYGKKGMGLINNPKKAAYNAVYNKTTLSLSDLINYNKNSTNNLKDKSNELSYNEMQQLSLKLNNDCNKYREIICSTTDPKEFFENYDKLVESLRIMQKYENKVDWQNANPSMMLGETLAKKDKCIKLLIDNIFKEQNNNKNLTFEKLFNYLDKIDDDNKKYLDSLECKK